MSTSTKLGLLLRKHLKKQGLRQQDFARRVGMESKYPSHIVTGRRVFPLDKLQATFVALKLYPGDAERAEFEAAAYLDNAPEEVQQMVEGLAGKLVKCEEESVSIKATLRKIREAAVRKGVELPESANDA